LFEFLKFLSQVEIKPLMRWRLRRCISYYLISIRLHLQLTLIEQMFTNCIVWEGWIWWLHLAWKALRLWRRNIVFLSEWDEVLWLSMAMECTCLSV